MSAEVKYLTAIGDFHGSRNAYRQSVESGNRSEATKLTAKMAGSFMRRVIYGSMCTFDYATNARLLMPFPVNEVVSARYGLAAGTAAGLIAQRGEELPSEFAKTIAHSEK